MHSVGIVKVEPDFLSLEFSGAEQGTGGYEGGATVVVVQSQHGQTMPYGALVLRMYVGGVANVGANSHTGMRYL